MQNLEVSIDKLIYERQREWSTTFTIDRLKLRDLIVEECMAQLTTQAEEIERLERKNENQFRQLGVIAYLRGDESVGDAYVAIETMVKEHPELKATIERLRKAVDELKTCSTCRNTAMIDDETPCDNCVWGQAVIIERLRADGERWKELAEALDVLVSVYRSQAFHTKMDRPLERVHKARVAIKDAARADDGGEG